MKDLHKMNISKYDYIDGISKSIVDKANIDFMEPWVKGRNIIMVFDAQAQVELQIMINANAKSTKSTKPHHSLHWNHICGIVYPHDYEFSGQ